MNGKIKAAIIFVVYAFLIFLISVLCYLFLSDSDSVFYAIFSADSSNVLSPDKTAYKFDNGILFFFKLIPAVLMTAEVFGFSWFFGVSSGGTKRRFSNRMLGHLKTVLITCVSCVIVCFVTEEALIPSVQNAVNLYEARARNYWEFTKLATEHSKDPKDDSLSKARFYAEEALKLFPKSMEERVLKLSEKYTKEELYSLYPEYMRAKKLAHDIEDMAVKPTCTTDVVATQVAEDIKEKDSYSYLLKAEEAFKKKDYLNAHYYAELVIKTTVVDGENRLRAKEIESLSWNLLTSEKQTFDENTGDLFAQKKAAYSALKNGDVLKAYYMLLKMKDENPADPDVLNYFDETLERLEKQYFFEDETDDKLEFETANNIYFSVTKPDGQVDLIFIGGISIVEDTGQLVQYFRNFSVTSVSADGHLQDYSYSVPYAKMTAQFASSVDPSVNPNNDRYIPYIFLRGIDRLSDNSRNVIRPQYKATRDEETSSLDVVARVREIRQLDRNAPSFYVLNIPFEDLALIRQACEGADKMPFLSLMRFTSKAEQYGFSSEVYTTEFAKRACFPFVILAIMIGLAILSFNYRLLSGRAFRFHWLLLFPLMTILLHFVLMLIDYMESLLALSLYSSLGAWCPVVMVAVSVVVVLGVSIRFLSSHGE